MHWTLIALLCLCAASFLLNAAQLAMVGSVRISGALVCLFWAAQELHWWATGGDSIVLFLTCDALLVRWFWRRGAADWSDRAIAALIPPTTACVIYAWWIGGPTVASWWLNTCMVIAQMALGLPRLVLQRSLGSFSHGSIKRLGVRNARGA
ncbi:hypothetical protein WBP07_17850 [Novosphingobium sp. BL-8A]|uniref:hypothetical protein n=1 Tax=Novosphingobium sp. BL-8A TaxID=3127639 RepID=UPI0037564E7B